MRIADHFRHSSDGQLMHRLPFNFMRGICSNFGTRSWVQVWAFAFALAFSIAVSSSSLAQDPPAPSQSSQIGDSVTLVGDSSASTVTGLVYDPASIGSGQVAWVITGSGGGQRYTMVKSVGQSFYSDTNPPVAFQVTSISGGSFDVDVNGASNTLGLNISASEYSANFSSTTTADPLPLPPPSGPGGYAQIEYGNNGGNGRDGALFVPPSSGGSGATGPTNTRTLSANVNASARHGWEVGSGGGNGGKGGSSYASFWSGRDGGDGGKGGTVNATQS